MYSENQNSMNDIIQELTAKINRLKETQENEREDALQDLVHSINELSMHNRSYGVPPPNDSHLDMSNSFMSASALEDSMVSEAEEVPYFENVTQIKDYNKVMKNAIQETIKTFQNTSKDFLSNSFNRSNRNSVLLGELDNIKKTLNEAVEESKLNKSRSGFSSFSEGNDDVAALQDIYNQIQSVQFEIKTASQKLLESETMIKVTDDENMNLKIQLHKLEESLNHILLTEDEEPIRPRCKCELF
jgi:hypothetical protein